MAMTKAGMSDKIYNYLLSKGYGSVTVPTQGTATNGPTSLETLRYLCDAIAEGVVTEIQTNAKATGFDLPQGNSHNLDIV